MATDWEAWKQAAVARNYAHFGNTPTGLYYHALILSTANRQKLQATERKVSRLRAEVTKLNGVLAERKREIAALTSD